MAIADPPKIGDINWQLFGLKFTNLGDFLQAIITWFLLLVSGLAAIAIIYSGLMYITAGGDAEKALKARKNLMWAIIGVVVATLSYFIVSEIGKILQTSP